MFQSTTECIDSLAINDIAGQAVPEPGTSRTECSVADSLHVALSIPPVNVSALIHRMIGADGC